MVLAGHVGDRAAGDPGPVGDGQFGDLLRREHDQPHARTPCSAEPADAVFRLDRFIAGCAKGLGDTQSNGWLILDDDDLSDGHDNAVSVT